MTQTDSSAISPELLLFDLGGVLVQWEGVTALGDLCSERRDPDELRRFWLESPWIRRFETGGCSEEEFAAGVVADMDLEVAPTEFLARFLSWVRAPLPGALELLDTLGSRFELACLSNTNPTHWKRIRDDFGFGSRFGRAFVSFEMGHMKPDSTAFEHVLSETGHQAAHIVFFDDNHECVDAALALGFRARRTLGVDAVKEALGEIGVATGITVDGGEGG